MATTFNQDRTYLYQGIAGPLLFNSEGNIGLARDQSLLGEELIDLLLTLWQEVFMEPEDGMGLDQFINDPNDPDTYTVISTYLRDRMNNLEDRVTVKDIIMRQDEQNPSIMIVLVVWAINGSGDNETYTLASAMEV